MCIVSVILKEIIILIKKYLLQQKPKLDLYRVQVRIRAQDVCDFPSYITERKLDRIKVVIFGQLSEQENLK